MKGSNSHHNGSDSNTVQLNVHKNNFIDQRVLFLFINRQIHFRKVFTVHEAEYHFPRVHQTTRHSLDQIVITSNQMTPPV